MVGYRSAVCLRTSVADFDGEADFFHVTDGLTMMGGLVQSFDEKAMKSIGDRSKKSETIKVPVRRLSKILEEHQIEEVDYCSIDTEGSELMILRDLDFSRMRITVFSVENNSNTNEVRDYLATFGYTSSSDSGTTTFSIGREGDTGCDLPVRTRGGGSSCSGTCPASSVGGCTA